MAVDTQPKRRPTELATLDPWAEQFAYQEERNLLVAQARIEADKLRYTRKHELKGRLLSGVGYTTIGAAVCGVIQSHP